MLVVPALPAGVLLPYVFWEGAYREHNRYDAHPPDKWLWHGRRWSVWHRFQDFT